MTDAHQYTCGAADCSFQVRSENAEEVIELVQTHAMEVHDLTFTKQEVRDGIEDVSV